MNLNNYIEYTSLKIYATEFSQGHKVERYYYKSFSFKLKKVKDTVKIISKHDKNKDLTEVCLLQKKSFNVNTLLIMLELIEQAYNKKYTNQS
jgi:hypothetical protein